MVLTLKPSVRGATVNATINRTGAFISSAAANSELKRFLNCPLSFPGKGNDISHMFFMMIALLPPGASARSLSSPIMKPNFARLPDSPLCRSRSNQSRLAATISSRWSSLKGSGMHIRSDNLKPFISIRSASASKYLRMTYHGRLSRIRGCHTLNSAPSHNRCKSPRIESFRLIAPNTNEPVPASRSTA